MAFGSMVRPLTLIHTQRSLLAVYATSRAINLRPAAQTYPTCAEGGDIRDTSRTYDQCSLLQLAGFSPCMIRLGCPNVGLKMHPIKLRFRPEACNGYTYRQVRATRSPWLHGRFPFLDTDRAQSYLSKFWEILAAKFSGSA